MFPSVCKSAAQLPAQLEFYESDMDEADLAVNVDCTECREDFGPPPDDILRIPPPPLPYFLRLDSNNDSAQCNNQCAWAPNYSGVEFVELSHHGSTKNDTWFFIVGASCAGVLILGGLLTLLLLKFRSKLVNKSSIQAATTIVKSKNCESVLYPYPPTTPGPDSRVLWATLTPRGTTHHYTTPGSHSQAKHPYSSPSKPSLPPPDPPISFDNTGFDSDSQTPLMESYQLSELVESDGTSDSNTLKRAQRPRVSTPTRIEHPNLPPLNLHPHRGVRRAALQRRDSDVPCSSPI